MTLDGLVSNEEIKALTTGRRVELAYGNPNDQTILGNRTIEQVTRARDAASLTGRTAMAFMGMPHIPNVNGKFLENPEVQLYHRFQSANTNEGFTSADKPVEYYHGIVPLNRALVSVLDHGLLYGDGFFEGIISHDRGGEISLELNALVGNNGKVFQLREHMDRLYDTAEKMGITIPYSKEELAWQTIQAINASEPKKGESRYVRLVVTRGVGDLGTNPDKTVLPTVFSLAAQIQLYPPQKYVEGIEVTLANDYRQGDVNTSNPRIKATQYLGHIFALMEGKVKNPEALETIMLTRHGNVAEATVDNLFVIRSYKDGHVEVHTPSEEYVLPGITRAIVMDIAKEAKWLVKERNDMLPQELTANSSEYTTEVFMTGTGAGVVPIVRLDGTQIGEGRPGQRTQFFINKINERMASADFGASINSTPEEFLAYMNSPRNINYTSKVLEKKSN